MPYLLCFNQFSIVPKYTFLDYVRGGCELNFMVAVDFTGSNGNPMVSNSLHYIDPTGKLNQYEFSIMAVGDILRYYDADQLFPTFGFGGIYKGSVSHCFPLNFNEGNPEVKGIDGILGAYKNSLQRCGLSGPTIFSQVIGKALGYASGYQRSAEQKYLVLLIITDGIINDMDDTIANIVSAADYPMSIIIVGVGNADFSNMEVLDGDDVRLCANGKAASRDIVQFVPINKYINQPQAVLSSEILAEIPTQLLQYMEVRNIKPNHVEVRHSSSNITYDQYQGPITYDPRMRTNSQMNPNPNPNPQYDQNGRPLSTQIPYGNQGYSPNVRPISYNGNPQQPQIYLNQYPDQPGPNQTQYPQNPSDNRNYPQIPPPDNQYPV